MNRWREFAEAVPLPVWLASGLALLALVVGMLLPEPKPTAPLNAEAEAIAQTTAPPQPPAQPEPRNQAPVRTQPGDVAPSRRAIPEPRSRPTERAAIPTRRAPTVTPPPQSPPLEGFALPPLDQSDSLAREQLAALVGGGALRRWLNTDQLLRRFVAIAANASVGKVLRRQFPFVFIEEPFLIIERGSRIYMDPDSYLRYDPMVKVVMSIDSKALAKLLRRLSPLLERAYRELGYPQGNISQVLRESLQQIINAPVIEREIRLMHPSVMYRFADPALERRSLMDRQLLRMGPDNMRQLQRKAKELLAVL